MADTAGSVDMEPEDLETILAISLGGRVARAVCRESADDPQRAVESLHRRADALRAPHRETSIFDDRAVGKTNKEIVRLKLVARLIDELSYELDEELGVELARSA